jgi:hypothetical protein
MIQGSNDYLSLFQQSSELLSLQKNKENLDDAISIFADWLFSTSYELTEDDLVILIKVGGIIYRELSKGVGN